MNDVGRALRCPSCLGEQRPAPYRLVLHGLHGGGQQVLDQAIEVISDQGSIPGAVVIG